MPPLHLPLFATLGAWLSLIGTLCWMANTPTHLTSALTASQADIGIGLLLAAAGGALTTLVFGWLTTGEGNALMTARGVLGALVAASSGQPFLPLWAMLAVGAGAGVLVPLVQYLIEHLLRLDDPTSAVATHGTSALWGLLAVGVFADGRVDGIDATPISGLMHGEWGQFRAQATGAATIAVASFLLSWLLFAAVQGLTHAWQGEYTIRLPRRPRAKPKRTGKATRRGPRIRFARGQEENLPQVEATTAGETGILSEIEQETTENALEQELGQAPEDDESQPDVPQDER
jgi:ammonia channel protein AmtB